MGNHAGTISAAYTVGRVTPYDGANVLFVESDLIHIVRQRGDVEKGQEQAWLDQRIPITKLAILQQMMDLGEPLAIVPVNRKVI